MFNIGFTELLVIGAIALMILGPEKLPGLFRTLAQWSVKARRTVNEFKGTFEQEIDKIAGEEMKELRKLKSELGVPLSRRINSEQLSSYLEKGANALEKSNAEFKAETEGLDSSPKLSYTESSEFNFAPNSSNTDKPVAENPEDFESEPAQPDSALTDKTPKA